MTKEYIYRCSRECPIGKKCFVIKVGDKIIHPLRVMQKCKAYKSDIILTIDEKSTDVMIERVKERENGEEKSEFR